VVARGLESSWYRRFTEISLRELQRRVLRLLSTTTPGEMNNNLRNLAEFAERA
jgi:hypothetical protein